MRQDSGWFQLSIDTCRRLGAVARVGLTVRSVPWVQRRMRNRDLLHGALRGWLAVPQAPVQALELVLDALKQSILEDAVPGTSAGTAGRGALLPSEAGRFATETPPEGVEVAAEFPTACARLLAELVNGDRRQEAE